MTTVLDKFKSKEFLSSEQEWDMIDIISKGCTMKVKGQVRSAVLYGMFGIRDEPYWNKFKVTPNGVTFEATTKLVAQELKQIRKKLLTTIAEKDL